jgi:hypothetical protein
MWLITSGGFVSIVEHRDHPDTLIVRGRFRGDVSRFLGVPGIERETPQADYRFRAEVPRSMVADALLRACSKVDYPNFKDSITAKFRKAIAMRVWSIFHAAQQERIGR